MTPPTSWFAAAEPVTQMIADVRRHLQDGDFKAAVTAWCGLAQYLNVAEVELGMPEDDAPEYKIFADLIRGTAATGRNVARALDALAPAIRRRLFKATAYVREENFRAHAEMANLTERILGPMDPELLKKLCEAFRVEPPPPEPGEEWKNAT
jgi:hypothetical protein